MASQRDVDAIDPVLDSGSAHASGDRTFAEWEELLTRQPEVLKEILRAARSSPGLRHKRSHLTTTALNAVMENAGVTTAKSVVSNFLSGVQVLTQPQLQVLIRELVLRDVLPLRKESTEDEGAPSVLDPGYAACLGGLARAFAAALGTRDDSGDELRRWAGQYFLVRRSFFAPGRYCRAHLRLQFDDVTKTMLMVETNRHSSVSAVGATTSECSGLEPRELTEYFDGILFVQNSNMVVMVSSERIDGGRSRGLARVTMLDRFVLDPATGEVRWAQGQMLISGRDSEPVVIYQPSKPLSPAEARQASCLLSRGDVDSTVLAQLEVERKRSDLASG